MLKNVTNVLFCPKPKRCLFTFVKLKENHKMFKCEKLKTEFSVFHKLKIITVMIQLPKLSLII